MAFNKEEFARLLRLAKGNRSINKYGMDAGVDPGYISRLLRCLINTPPSAAIIQKLGSKAYNDITVETLMVAAGYLDSREKEISQQPPAKVKRIIDSLARSKDLDDEDYEIIADQVERLIEWAKKKRNP